MKGRNVLAIMAIVIGAGVLGLIIMVMEGDGEFPGWMTLGICVLSALIPSTIVNAFIPPELFIVGLTVGAVVAGCMISAMCGMDLKRASIAASIYLAFQIGISFALFAIT